MKRLYVGMATGHINVGHINIVNEATKYGDVIGLLTDEAIATYKRYLLTPFEQRKKVMETVKGASKVVTRISLDYKKNLKKYKPDSKVHGDDWKTGIQKQTREKVIKTLNKRGGS